MKGTGKTLLLTAARTRRKKFEYQPLRTLQGALLAENHKQATETQYHRNRSLQRDAGHTSHHHEKKFGTWCAEHGYLTFIPEYTPVPETNLFGQLGDLLKAFVVIHRCAERYGADMSRMYLVGDGAGAALACLVYALLWNPVSMQHLEDELPFDVPQEAKLSFKAVCLQNGILDLSSRKMNAIALSHRKGLEEDQLRRMPVA